ncbi:hypothetical protein [Pannonibacter phragmitetus]|uniref:hypothetical protein n=1 Tax=Pannonibacter phragmitetus TaxID=121719 RepID=UPI0013DE4034|nr:hypothetical protein [Pannonibacter phragmitetus]
MAMLAKAVNAPADVPLEAMHRALPFRHAMARPWHPFRRLFLEVNRQSFHQHAAVQGGQGMDAMIRSWHDGGERE